MTLEELKTKYTLGAIIESLLFVSVMPMSINQLSSALNETKKTIENALDDLENDYRANRGFRLQKSNGKVQLVTAPELSSLIEEFIGIEVTTS